MTIQDDRLVTAILQWMGFTVFRRLGPWDYELFGDPSPSFAKFFHQGESFKEFWKQSEMLDFFMNDVEDYFRQEGPAPRTEKISSGIWLEAGADGAEVSFMAQALPLVGEQLLIVRALGEEYEEKVDILQRARVNLLERRRLNVDLNEYKQKSRCDGLTGLFNRSTFDELLRENMALSDKNGANLGLILADIDDFKSVNDTYGHVTGDMVLSEIGQILRTILRPEDAACRYGGEEFAILIQHATRQQIGYVAEKVRAYMETYHFNGPPRVSVSIGCSTYHSEETPENFINRVDMALYEAKRSGKNKVVVKWPVG